jgi:hypothetical protein
MGVSVPPWWIELTPIPDLGGEYDRGPPRRWVGHVEIRGQRVRAEVLREGGRLLGEHVAEHAPGALGDEPGGLGCADCRSPAGWDHPFASGMGPPRGVSASVS